MTAVRPSTNYWHEGRKTFGRVITCDPDDGASLLFEPLDDCGDIFGGDIFRCEHSDLQQATKEKWDAVYSGPDCWSFEEMNKYAKPKIITVAVRPPIPTRSFDWCAYFDGQDEGPYGWGDSELVAIIELEGNYSDEVPRSLEDETVSADPT